MTVHCRRSTFESLLQEGDKTLGLQILYEIFGSGEGGACRQTFELCSNFHIVLKRSLVELTNKTHQISFTIISLSHTDGIILREACTRICGIFEQCRTKYMVSFGCVAAEHLCTY
jgi:hypothetical protein